MLILDNFTATPILREIQTVPLLANLEVLNFDFSKVEQLLSQKSTTIQSSESLKLPKMTFLDRLTFRKFDFTQNQSGGIVIKFQ